MTQGDLTIDLAPLPYHHAVVEALRQREPELWAWMAKVRVNSLSTELKRELLVSTYRLDRDGHSELLDAAATAAAAVGVDVPVAIYQAEGSPVPNAGLVYVPDEAIVLLSGPITELLEPNEFIAVLGHELAHHHLWSTDRGIHLVADRLVGAMVNDDGSELAAETARRLSLTTELFADRGALLACGDLEVAVSALTKVATGTRSVVASSYLRQAEEVVQSGTAASAGTTHPETFVRAIALRDWHRDRERGLPAEGFVRAAVEGPVDIASLDLVSQQALETMTAWAMTGMLRPQWMRTDAVLSEARAYFPDILDQVERRSEARPRPGLEFAQSSREFLAYVLVDLATADDELDRAPLPEAAAVASHLGVRDELDALLGKELHLAPAEVAALPRPPTIRDDPADGDSTSVDEDRAEDNATADDHEDNDGHGADGHHEYDDHPRPSHEERHQRHADGSTVVSEPTAPPLPPRGPDRPPTPNEPEPSPAGEPEEQHAEATAGRRIVIGPPPPRREPPRLTEPGASPTDGTNDHEDPA